MIALKVANLVLLALFPLAWFAPLLRAGFLPFFRLDEISVISGLAVLWRSDPALAVLVAVFALVAPVAKGVAIAAVQFGGPVAFLGPVRIFGRLAMADIFLIAIYIVAAKGVGVGRVETAWGLWLFTFCVLGSLLVAYLTERALRRDAAPR
jgi:paraquat-inducible protein A